MNKVRPSSFAMTALLGAMTAFGSISNDMLVPSMPAIGADLHAIPETVQLTLSAFLIGFAIGQLLYGPTSDKYGRRPVLLVAFVAFLVATAICMAARSIEVLIAARVIQSLGASGPIILARAMVRDMHEGPRAARELSIMASIMGVSPVVAPVIGGVLQEIFGWRSTFVVVEILALCIAIPATLGLPETLARKQTAPLRFASVLKSFAIVWKNPAFRAYAAILTACYSGLFAFVSASSFVFQGVFGLTALDFSAAFSACSISFVVGSLAATRLGAWFGLDGALAIGVAALAVGGGAQLLFCLISPRSVFSVLGPEIVFTIGIGISMPQLLAGAMTPFPERAGAASSLLGLIQMSGAALVGSALGAFLGGSALPFATTTAFTGLAAGLAHVCTRKIRRAQWR